MHLRYKEISRVIFPSYLFYYLSFHVNCFSFTVTFSNTITHTKRTLPFWLRGTDLLRIDSSCRFTLMKTTNETSHCPFIMSSDTRLHAVCQSVQDRCSTINTRCFHDRHRKAHGTKGTAGGRIKLMGPVIPALGCTNVNSITNQRQEPLRGRVSRACGCEPDTTCSRRGPVTGSYKHTLMMEAVSSSSVNIYQTTWGNIPDDSLSFSYSSTWEP
jgi:hypothetical protein